MSLLEAQNAQEAGVGNLPTKLLRCALKIKIKTPKDGNKNA